MSDARIVIRMTDDNNKSKVSACCPAHAVLSLLATAKAVLEQDGEPQFGPKFTPKLVEMIDKLEDCVAASAALKGEVPEDEPSTVQTE